MQNMESTVPMNARNKYREAREQEGKAQVNVWLGEGARETLDRLVKERGYKNRSVAIEEILIETFNRKGSQAE